jgi:predicted MFS family arabinose efflux permease
MHVVEHGFVAGWHAAMMFTLLVTAVFGILIYALVPSRKTTQATASP